MNEWNVDMEKMVLFNQSAYKSDITEYLTCPGFTVLESVILGCQDSSKRKGASLRWNQFLFLYQLPLVLMAAHTYMVLLALSNLWEVKYPTVVKQ